MLLFCSLVVLLVTFRCYVLLSSEQINIRMYYHEPNVQFAHSCSARAHRTLLLAKSARTLTHFIL